MNLKAEYELRVEQLSKKHLQNLADEVVKMCTENINKGMKLPYNLTLINVNINSTYDLTRKLSDKMNCNCHFDNNGTTIKVIVHEFI